MHTKIVAIGVVTIVILQACCCCTILGGPQPPYTITPSDEHVQRLEERMDKIDIGPDGAFSLTISEEEMTSLVVQFLEEEQQEQVIVSQPQVHFRNDRIEVYAMVHIAESFTLPALLAFTADVVDGKVDVTIEEVTLGPIPAPESLTQSMTEQINQAFAESTTSDDGDVVITDIEIGDKELTIHGQTVP